MKNQTSASNVLLSDEVFRTRNRNAEDFLQNAFWKEKMCFVFEVVRVCSVKQHFLGEVFIYILSFSNLFLSVV